VQRDVLLDNMEREVEQFCVRLLALRQPWPRPALIIASMKISQDLERIGDYARQRRQAGDPRLRAAAGEAP
jgi:phosphate transport system protein